MSFKFGKNGGKVAPHVSQLIDTATDATVQGSENWALFMDICDIISTSEEGPKDAIKAIRKRFATKNSAVTSLTLSLLETCVKNCGKRFHIHIATKDFLQDFIKIISPKYNPPIELQMTVLGLLQTWAYAFQTSPELKEVGKQYQELKNKGVEFPPLDVEKATQAHIPAKSTPTAAVSDLGTMNIRMQHSALSPTGQQCMVPRMPSSGHPLRQTAAGQAPGSLTPDHLAKIRSELNTVQQNCRVFGEMLTELVPGQESRSDVELLEDLNMTCRQMQKRIMELIQVVQVEQVTEELLRVNDELNNVFLRYDRYQRLKCNQQNAKTTQPLGEFPLPPAYAPSPSVATQSATKFTSPTGATTSPPQPLSGSVPVDNLIDLGDTPSPKPSAPSGFEPQFINMSIHDESSKAGIPKGGEGLGMFAGLADTSNSACETKAPIESGRDTEFEEMEKWLMKNTGGTSPFETATSSEFDQFLSERAKEADRLPPVVPTRGPGSTVEQKDDEPLFTL